jgi:hypothetical protein
MKTLITTLITIALAITIQGCAVKKTDTPSMKVLKHTINAPGYAVLAVGYVGTKAEEVVAYSILYGITKIAKATTDTAKLTVKTVSNQLPKTKVDSSTNAKD